MRFESFRHMLSYWAEQTPDAPALRYYDESYSYARLYSAVLTRADDLRTEKKSCIGILADGSLDCVITLFAANLAGLQIALLDPNQSNEVLSAMMRYTDTDTLWGDPVLKEELTPFLADGVSDGSGKILFFTSGTTERSKAVVLTDHSLCQSAWNGSQMLPLSPSDTLLCMLPLCHVFGFVCGLLWGISCGACVALGRGARYYICDCSFYNPTAISAVPMLLDFLLRIDALNPELSTILIGAGDCPPALLSSASARGIHVCFGYGLTETSSGVAISTGGDPYAMDICPDDTIVIAEDGEVLIDSPTCMMQGYYKRPDDTAAVLRDGLLRTGDLGRIDEDGRLHIIGRKKDILVLPDGTKIFLPEYEAEIISALGYNEIAVTLKGSRPVLIYSGDAEIADLSRRLRPVMAQYPRGQQIAEIFIVTDPLPRTATGKIKRWELQQKAGIL